MILLYEKKVENEQFFEQELWHLFGDGKTFDNPARSGRACLGTLGRELRVRAQFISTHISGSGIKLGLTVPHIYRSQIHLVSLQSVLLPF